MKAIFLRALEETEDKDRVLREAITLPEQAMAARQRVGRRRASGPSRGSSVPLD